MHWQPFKASIFNAYWLANPTDNNNNKWVLYKQHKFAFRSVASRCPTDILQLLWLTSDSAWYKIPCFSPAAKVLRWFSWNFIVACLFPVYIHFIYVDHHTAKETLGRKPTYFSRMTFSFIAPKAEWLLPCRSLQFARCRWCCSIRQAFSRHNLTTCSSSSSILFLCFSNNSCCVSMILFSSFKYSAALLGFSAGCSILIVITSVPQFLYFSPWLYNWSLANSDTVWIFRSTIVRVW